MLKHYLRRRHDIKTNQNDGQPWTSQLNPQEFCVEGCKSLHFNNPCKRKESARSNLTDFQLYKRTELKLSMVCPKLSLLRIFFFWTDGVTESSRIQGRQDMVKITRHNTISSRVQEQILSSSEKIEQTVNSGSLKKRDLEMKVSKKKYRANTLLANSTFYNGNNI